jgi:hypothetical protein
VQVFFAFVVLPAAELRQSYHVHSGRASLVHILGDIVQRQTVWKTDAGDADGAPDYLA